MKIIITGGAGFIGSHLTDRLVKEGQQVMILDDFSTGTKKFLTPAAKVEKADIRNAARVDKIFSSFKPEAVFHLAAMVDVRASIAAPVKDFNVNVAGSLNILEACRQHGVKKLVFSSSGGAIYGDNPDLPLSEQAAPEPISPYGVAKLVFERYAKVYAGLYGLSIINLRYPNVYGPRQGTKGEGGVVAIFCKRLLAKKELLLFGTGAQTRDFIFVDDVVESNVKALKSPKKWGIYNVSTGRETSVNKIAESLLALSGQTVKIKRVKAIKGEVRRNALANNLIKKELKWSPRVGIDEGLAKTWAWFRENI